MTEPSTNGHGPATNGDKAAQEQGVSARNVLGGPLAACGTDPVTGFYRTGSCESGPDDVGVHAVCAVVTAPFLAYSASRGNDLTAPWPAAGFPGLAPGDRWCLCASRWHEALMDGVAPLVDLQATHERALEVIDLADLQAHALDAE